MLQKFGPAGLNPKKGVARLILNRWDHAYSLPHPQFSGGASGPEPADTLRHNVRGISSAQSELTGVQSCGPVATEDSEPHSTPHSGNKKI